MACAVVLGLLERQAVIYDIDGVVVDTAGLHAATWAELFGAALAPPALGRPTIERFDPKVEYRRYFDRRRRDDGVRAVLATYGLRLLQGEPADPPVRLSVRGLAHHKGSTFRTRSPHDGEQALPAAGGLLRALRAHRRRSRFCRRSWAWPSMSYSPSPSSVSYRRATIPARPILAIVGPSHTPHPGGSGPPDRRTAQGRWDARASSQAKFPETFMRAGLGPQRAPSPSAHMVATGP